jgi:phage/plasmid-like protein (TIGR03299 family)
MFSVREVPWHGLGVVLDSPPVSIDDALDKSGLGWKVAHNAVLLGQADGTVRPAVGFKANVREDTGELLGIVSDEYSIIDNRDAFRFLDSLINSDVCYETAGSINGGKRVFVTVRLPEWIEVAGDPHGTYIFCVNSHDGSAALTAAVSSVRVVCQNTVNAAMGRAEGQATTFKFRHTGDVTAKYDEARKVMGLTINLEKQFKKLGDSLGRQSISSGIFDRKVVRELFPIDITMGRIAVANRERARESVLNIFAGHGPAGDTTGNAGGTKWCAFQSVVEYADYGRRYTVKSNQVARSFEDSALKEQALALVRAA